MQHLIYFWLDSAPKKNTPTTINRKRKREIKRKNSKFNRNSLAANHFTITCFHFVREKKNKCSIFVSHSSKNIGCNASKTDVIYRCTVFFLFRRILYCFVLLFFFLGVFVNYFIYCCYSVTVNRLSYARIQVLFSCLIVETQTK